MEFFRLEEDKHFVNPIQLEIKEELLRQTEPFVWFTKIKDKEDLPDFFLIQKWNQRYFCVSDSLKKLFDVYGNGYLRATPFFPTDAEKKRQEAYWIIELPDKEFLVKRPQHSTEELKLVSEPPYELHCFQGNDGQGDYILVSLFMTENILRKYYHGLLLVPVPLKEGEI